MRYLILGATEARDGRGRPVPLGGNRLRALLTALALRADSEAAVPVEVLIGDVWADPDTQPADAPAALQALVGRLRRALGREAVRSLPGGYRLAAGPDEIDLHRFVRQAHAGERALAEGDPDTAAERLREALALWRGPALSDLPDRVAAAARIEALRQTAVQHRIAAELALGHADRVLPELRELAAGRPLDEPLQALRLRALRETGRTAEALETYEELRRAFSERLGADPGGELRALHAELLAATAPAPGPAPATGPAPDPATGPARAPDSAPGAAAGPATPGTRNPAAAFRTSTASAASTQPLAPATSGTPPPPGTRPDGSAMPDRSTPRRPGASAAPVPPGNLRARLTSFVGREGELATLHADLARSRLVTLTGPGGSGKTRLAEEAAAEALRTGGDGGPHPDPYGGPHPGPHGGPHPGPPAPPYADGIWLVELAPLDQPAAVPGAVLSALGRRETRLSATLEGTRTGGPHQPADATERLLEHLAHRRLLLVLDNCEHVVASAAALAETLLARCPGLTVLATSREPLGIPGETVRPVEPLLPAPAHRLFAERGADVRPGFTPDTSTQDRAAVAEICRRLDGLPLAIELAAARLRSLTPRQIADRLDDRFRLLTRGSRTVLPRQQTLRAVVDWSWDLLDERERTVLRRMSVFAGGCTLSAAETVCAAGDVPENAVLDVLAALVDKSILIADRPPAAAETGVRYRMLETIHEYAAERAAEHPRDRAAAEERHTRQLLRFVTAAEPRLRSAEQLSWLPRVEAELDNIRAALHRALRAGDVAAVYAFVLAMGWFWWLRNYRDEGGAWADHALRLLPADPGSRDPEQEIAYRELQLLRYFLLHELYGQDVLRRPEHREVAEAIVKTFRRPLPQSARFPGLVWPFSAFLNGGLRAVAPLMDIAVSTLRALGGPWELAVCLLFRAHVRIDSPRGLAAARRDLPEIDELSQATGDRWLLCQVCGLRAEIALMHGRYEQARGEYETALRHAQALGALTEVPFLLVRIAEVWYRQGDYGHADKLARQAREDAERLGIADAQVYAHFMHAVLALERGETTQARELVDTTLRLARSATPPAVFEVVFVALEARVTAAEGVRPGVALRTVRDALAEAAENGDAPEYLLARVLLDAGLIALAAGHPGAAARLADVARRMRGDLPVSVPDARAEQRLRSGLGAAGPEGGTEDARPADGRETAGGSRGADEASVPRGADGAGVLRGTDGPGGPGGAAPGAPPGAGGPGHAAPSSGPAAGSAHVLREALGLLDALLDDG
ncbi:BTAD domain-containing putative transcriptional regulator [Streptomyces sp. JJ36]|uniref:AfsR/SARP family transcriptional regulator n=1 Tax=Streptomyces sp. JJ36 TaxID=2736645 RepID=UPI0027E488B9|nr:BTAD domain-containing putative transcriptional regulator [Streptomyces sp. JJ36]